MPDNKKVLLAVSFGSSHNDAREAAIGAIENSLQRANPEYEVRRAFTSRAVINIIAECENLKTDDVDKAMQRIVADDIKEVIIQPTHILPGKEYDGIIAAVKPYAAKLESLRIGVPLLTSDSDYDALVRALVCETEEYNAPDTAIVFMGHGTRHAANNAYSKLQRNFFEAGYSNYFVGTFEADPSLKDIMSALSKTAAKKVILLPLMVTAGVHACGIMAGSENGSWKTELEKAGYQTECVLKGLGEYLSVQQIFAEHANDAK